MRDHTASHTEPELQVDVDDGLEAELEALRAKMRRLADQNSALENKCRNLKAAEPPPTPVADNSGLEAKLDAQAHQIQQLEFLNQQLRDQVAQYLAMIKALEKQLEALKKRVAELLVSGDASSAALRLELESLQAENEKLLARIAELEEMLAQTRARFEEYMNSTGGVDEEKKKLHALIRLSILTLSLDLECALLPSSPCQPATLNLTVFNRNSDPKFVLP